MPGLIALACLVVSQTVFAGPMFSSTFDNHWNVIDSGGSTRTSAFYELFDAMAQVGSGFRGAFTIDVPDVGWDKSAGKKLAYVALNN